MEKYNVKKKGSSSKGERLNWSLLNDSKPISLKSIGFTKGKRVHAKSFESNNEESLKSYLIP